MKLRLASLSLLALALMLAAVPAASQVVYSNGPINGNTDAWSIEFGFIVSDTFNVANNGTTITGFSFGAWLTPGGSLDYLEVSITSGENGGTSYFDEGLSNWTASGCVLNPYGYDVCKETTTFNGPTLDSGTYWVNLQDANPIGNPVYWDENSGPSSASENSVGTIPSESFTVLGGASSSRTFDVTVTTGGTVPEPTNIMLFGSGILSLIAAVRRRLM